MLIKRQRRTEIPLSPKAGHRVAGLVQPVEIRPPPRKPHAAFDDKTTVDRRRDMPRPLLVHPVEPLEKLPHGAFVAVACKIGKRVARPRVEQLERRRAVRGRVRRDVRVLVEKSRFFALERPQRRDKRLALPLVGRKTPQRVQDVRRVGAAVRRYAEVARAAFVLPNPAAVPPVRNLVRSQDAQDLVDDRSKIDTFHNCPSPFFSKPHFAPERKGV